MRSTKTPRAARRPGLISNAFFILSSFTIWLGLWRVLGVGGRLGRGRWPKRWPRGALGFWLGYAGLSVRATEHVERVPAVDVGGDDVVVVGAADNGPVDVRV